MTPEYKQHFKQLQTVISAMADQSIELDAIAATQHFEYDPDDAMNAMVFFAHIMNNIMHHRMAKKTISKETYNVLARDISASIETLFKMATGMTPDEFIAHRQHTPLVKVDNE